MKTTPQDDYNFIKESAKTRCCVTCRLMAQDSVTSIIDAISRDKLSGGL
jgi:hypothetical protein